MSTAFEGSDKASIVTPKPRSAHICRAPGAGARLWPRIHSHIRVIRPAATLGRNPGDVLIRVLDVASFTVDAVLRVDHEAGRARLLHPLVKAGWTVAGGWAPGDVVRGRLLQLEIGDFQVRRLVLLVIGIGKKHRGEAGVGDCTVGVGIGGVTRLRPRP